MLEDSAEVRKADRTGSSSGNVCAVTSRHAYLFMCMHSTLQVRVPKLKRALTRSHLIGDHH